MHSSETEAHLEKEHLEKLRSIYRQNLQTIEQQIREIQELPASFVPTVLLHNLREVQQKLNEISQRLGEQPPFTLSQPDINPHGYALQADLTADRTLHVQQLLTIYHINLEHAKAEAERLAARGITHPMIIATIQLETDNISLAEKFLYQVPTETKLA